MENKKSNLSSIIISFLVFALVAAIWAVLQMLLNPFGSGLGDFQSYRGPVLPMTSLNGADGVDVDRNVDFDFAPYQDGNDYSTLGKGAAGITDTYILTNTTGETKTLELVYGFQGQFIDHPEEFPSITVDGVMIQPELYPSVDMEELVWNAHNFDRYSQVLEENDFLSTALQQSEELDIPVTAYHFTDLAYEGAEVAGFPMLTLRFSLDENTTVWTMIVDEFGAEQNGKQRMMFRIDRAEAWVFTVGGTFIDPEFGGNKDYNVTDSSAIDNISYKLETYEITLNDVIQHFAQSYDFWAIEGQNTYPNAGGLTPELLVDGTIKRIHSMGQQNSSEKIMLIESLFHKVVTEPRMMYLVFPVVLESGQSVTVEATYIQEPSLDISGPKHYREGYELATKLGSDLHFANLSSSLSNTALIELGKQNFGFDLEKGITEVILDLQVDRYYLEVKIK